MLIHSISHVIEKPHGFEVSRKTLRGRRQRLLSWGWQLPAPLWSAQGRGALGVLQAQGWAGPSWERGRGGEQVAEPVIKSSGSAWPAKVDFLAWEASTGPLQESGMHSGFETSSLARQLLAQVGASVGESQVR